MSDNCAPCRASVMVDRNAVANRYRREFKLNRIYYNLENITLVMVERWSIMYVCEFIDYTMPSQYDVRYGYEDYQQETIKQFKADLDRHWRRYLTRLGSKLLPLWYRKIRQGKPVDGSYNKDKTIIPGWLVDIMYSNEPVKDSTWPKRITLDFSRFKADSNHLVQFPVKWFESAENE